ncbi:hypothetical protein SNOG_06069 [Parastagonospora nodorum SN15]|uniref:Uncharacterized protein n=1 Tax=Phaeosphaeria nodorum (strain SN15 / ATCC MYA-4574 / FGSC 10173) TaxID=321614 RepID=Q0UQ95_PHANO|nr:hypothetical protein SNOG_06069 [Parastagonospora nodorum SN15]EAT87133.1 hypothetical protein SNOG_06069 [Parastagonospora nodorum SN15]
MPKIHDCPEASLFGFTKDLEWWEENQEILCIPAGGANDARSLPG